MVHSQEQHQIIVYPTTLNIPVPLNLMQSIPSSFFLTYLRDLPKLSDHLDVVPVGQVI